MDELNPEPPVLDYATPGAKPQRPLLRVAVIFSLSAFLTGFLPLVTMTTWYAYNHPDTDFLLLPILIILLSLIIPPAFGILLASLAVVRRFTQYRTPRSWWAAATAGAIYTILLAAIGAVCSSQPLLGEGGSSEAAFAIFAAIASGILIMLPYWLLKRADRGKRNSPSPGSLI